MNGERHDFGEAMSMRGTRNFPNSTTGYQGQVGFLSKKELSLSRATAQIVGVVVLVPLFALIVWMLLDVISSSGESEMAPVSAYDRPTAIAFADRYRSRPQGEADA